MSINLFKEMINEHINKYLNENSLHKETSTSLINHIHKTYGGKNKINDRHNTIGTTGHSTELKSSEKKNLHKDLVAAGWEHSVKTDRGDEKHTYIHPKNKNVSVHHTNYAKGHINSHLSNRVRTVSHDPKKGQNLSPVYD